MRRQGTPRWGGSRGRSACRLQRGDGTRRAPRRLGHESLHPTRPRGFLPGATGMHLHASRAPTRGLRSRVPPRIPSRNARILRTEHRNRRSGRPHRATSEAESLLGAIRADGARPGDGVRRAQLGYRAKPPSRRCAGQARDKKDAVRARVCGGRLPTPRRVNLHCRPEHCSVFSVAVSAPPVYTRGRDGARPTAKR